MTNDDFNGVPVRRMNGVYRVIDRAVEMGRGHASSIGALRGQIPKPIRMGWFDEVWAKTGVQNLFEDCD